MQVSVENTSSLGRRLTVEIPASKVSAEKTSRMTDLSKSVRLDGFRKGKVPQAVIEKRFGKQVHQETIAKLLEESLKDALDQENLRPAGRPMFEEIKDEAGQDLQYIVSFDIFPEIDLGDCKEIALEKPVAEISQEDIDIGIKRLQEQFSDWQECTREAKLGDQVTIDFVGSIDDVPFENGSAQDVKLELGSGQFIPGFEDQLVGVKAGDSRDLQVTFPEDYNAKDLAGKEAVFKVDVKVVAEKQEAAVDEAFAKRIGIQDGDVEKIQDTIRENLTKFMGELVMKHMREAALEALLGQYPIEVPKSLVDQEVESIQEDLKRRQGPNALEEQSPEALEQEAEKRVRLGLLLNEVIRVNKLQTDEARVRSKINEMSAMFGNTQFIENMYYQSKELLQSVQHSVLTEQAAEWIVEHATITEKPSTFKDIAEKST